LDNPAHTVTVRGTLTANITRMTRGVSTKVQSHVDYVDTGTSVFYRADSTYCIVEPGAVDTSKRGTWSLDSLDSRLTMFQQVPNRDTTVYVLTLLSANRLNAVVDEEYCDAINLSNCYRILELRLGLADSITAATWHGTVVLDRR
jgi:hypothetical protein